MHQVFISYNSGDYEYAVKFYDILKLNKIDVWFAPAKIQGGENFAEEIGRQFNDDDNYEERAKKLADASVFLLILSKGSMQSDWVKKELKMAIKKKKPIFVAKVDHSELTDEFEYMLIDIQIMDCYHMNQNAVEKVIETLKKNVGVKTIQHEFRKLFNESELGIHRITCGDPYYEEPFTLSVSFSGNQFFLAPPNEIITGPDLTKKKWCAENNFADKDDVFGSTLEAYVKTIPIPDLLDRIEDSRTRVFRQFLNRENGCYFNNYKFGVEDINPFSRSNDAKERSKLEIRVFKTDYFTHRVMKDVCKKLVSEQNSVINEIDYSGIGQNRIFFTSLGINLLLFEDSLQEERGILITSRSTNSAETYHKKRWSLSVIEGVSISDCDEYQRIVSLALSAERGLLEELNVTKEYYKTNSMKFYEIFVNRSNLEMGIVCSVELKKDYRIENDIIPLHGKDQELEIADKRMIGISKLESFIRDNYDAILPQALYTLCVFLENNGIQMIDRFQPSVIKKQSCLFSKRGHKETCGDCLVDDENFIAIIDGATPKGNLLWDGMKGDVFAASLLAETIRSLPPDIEAKDAIEELNRTIEKQYDRFNIDIKTLKPEEQLQASVVIFSYAKKEVWSFGDCQLRINQKDYRNIKKGDKLLSDLRAFAIEAAELQNNELIFDDEEDYGRTQILPFLKQLALFANSDKSFGYDVINGGKIVKERVKVYPVQPGDHVVLASDGYPRLFDTLEETEKYLKECLEEDPNCVNRLRGTKSIIKGNASYDDRCFIGFTVE